MHDIQLLKFVLWFGFYFFFCLFVFICGKHEVDRDQSLFSFLFKLCC